MGTSGPSGALLVSTAVTRVGASTSNLNAVTILDEGCRVAYWEAAFRSLASKTTHLQTSI